ncbi:unnamed protein product [Orchesella dallaii]|uniref:Uncharacterized protein n=1 Tax=Orchesella dallaii TaxID=48710 RepID=A0ABP1QWC2_9HEXA
MSINDSLLTPLTRKAYHLFEASYSWIYPHFLKLHLGDAETGNAVHLTLTRWHYTLILWYISEFVITCFIGFGSCVVVCLLQLFEPRPSIQAYHICICFGLAVASMAEWMTCIVLLRSPEFSLAFNEIFTLDKYEKVNRVLRTHLIPRRGRDIFGSLIILLTIGGILIGPGIAVTGVLFNLDPFYFLFEEVLPHPYI